MYIIKYIIYTVINFAAHIFWLFPIKKNRIVFTSHRNGMQYSDSPKYITEYLLSNYKDKFEIIWFVNDIDKFSYLTKKGIRLARMNSLLMIYYLNTSSVCICNAGFNLAELFWAKRKTQLVIHTMHGGGSYKTDAAHTLDQTKKFLFWKYTQDRHKIFDLYLSSCEKQSKYNIRINQMYTGEILESGLPRNDIFFKKNENIRLKVRNFFQVNSNEKILLFAPTWKKDNDKITINIDYSKLVQNLCSSYGGKWKILLRLHHLTQIEGLGIEDKNSAYIMNATDYPDVQELIISADMILTDYSSLMWDSALAKKPILLYTPDLFKYTEERGFNVPIEEWNLLYAQRESELYDFIKNSDLESLRKRSEKHLEIFGSFEKGIATEKIVERIMLHCFNKKEN